MPNHIHGIIEIKKSMDVLDWDACDDVDVHNNMDVRDIVGAKNFSPLPHPPSPQPHPPSPLPHPPSPLPHPPSPLPQISPSAQSCGQNIIVKYNF